MSAARGVTVLIHRDGDLESRSFRVPLWIARTILLALAAICVIAIVIGVLYAPIVRTAATVPGLKRRITHLEAENAQVQELARSLAAAEARYDQIRGMLGGDIVPAAPDEHAIRLPAALPIQARPPADTARYEAGPSVPTHWPLDDRGVVTRGQISPGVRDETHPGIDIAIPTGTPIRAAGGGIISQTGEDPEYGLFVVLEHPDGYQSLYGHASRLLVAVADTVSAGQVIALSGSTGRSTGPHLHFEIRVGGRAVDPRTVVREE
jgi:murein DD-endopeptidase MepM/ murein hydrolase activator NlpD